MSAAFKYATLVSSGTFPHNSTLFVNPDLII